MAKDEVFYDLGRAFERNRQQAVADLEAQLTHSQERIAELSSAFAEYAHHDSNCAVRKSLDIGCTCRLHEVWDAVIPPDTLPSLDEMRGITREQQPTTGTKEGGGGE